MKFTKMHGAGNDYIYFNCLEEETRNGISNPEALSIKLSDRHFSVGGDGIVLICPSRIADVKMRMFNADGSEGKMCGNAIRCVAKFVADRGIVEKDEIEVETLSGVKRIKVFIECDVNQTHAYGKVIKATVDMGKPSGLKEEETTILDGQGRMLKQYPLSVDNNSWEITTVSMGNPHCVVFVPQVWALDLKNIGPGFEKHPAFPQQINTEFVRVLDPKNLEMRVWERGSGETLACGTGACAAVVAAIENGYCEKNTDVTVKLLGGELSIHVTDETVFMTGDAVEAFNGEVDHG
jgi:diaminopimelate epimerase